LHAQRLRRARVAVAREIDQACRYFVLIAELVKVDRLGAAGRLAREGEALAPEQGVDRARFADVRAPGEGELGRARRRDIARPAGRGEKLCLREYSNKIAPFDDSGARG